MLKLKDFVAAQKRIKGVAARTPLVAVASTTDKDKLYLKLESMQPIGSFKLRGAYNMVSQLSKQEKKRGIIAHSSGNHAQGAAYAARAVGCAATIVLPDSAPKIKVDATKALGAEIVIVGPKSYERVEMAEKLAAEHGYTPVPPYNDERIIAGQGTIGLEILEDLKDVDLVLVQVSGGGLISGVATAIKSKKKKVKIYGVEPEISADARDSLHQKKLVKWDPEAVTKTIADGMRTTPVGEIPFQYITKYVDDIVTVTEDEIRAAVKKLALECRIIAEPSGATTAAAFFYHRDKLPKAKKTVAVISGGNIAPEMLREILG